jgi:hypothetical protein
VSDLVATIVGALRDHDPLDPWLTESAWDENYWRGEAEKIGSRVRPGMTQAEVRSVVVDVLGRLVGSSADGEAGLREQSRRLDAVAKAVVGALA